jgi:hypothetical protein
MIIKTSDIIVCGQIRDNSDRHIINTSLAAADLDYR